MTKSFRDAVLALSLSSLCFISRWRVLLNPGHYSYYYWKNHPGFTEIIALILDVLLLAVLFWAGFIIARGFDGVLLKGARAVFISLLIIPLNSLRISDTKLDDVDLFGSLGRAHVMFLGCILLVTILLLLWRWSKQITSVVVFILQILAPFSLIAVSEGIWLAQRHRSHVVFFERKTPGAGRASEVEPSRRSLWLVFDEMDQRMLFDARPHGIRSPSFDRIRSQAIYADNAYPPAGETLMSMPALITGRIVVQALPSRPDELMLTFDGGKEAEGWSGQSNIFSTARAAGFKTALVGWYHPYCRVMGADLDFCYCEPSISEANPVLDTLSVAGAMRLCARDMIFRIPLLFRVLKGSYTRELQEQHIVAHRRIMAQAHAVVREQDLNLTLIHFPIPHHPFIYDRIQEALSSTADNNYFGNLELADNILGELRREMEVANTWDKTAVLITSDHWWRKSAPVRGRRDHRVPFILKLSGQVEGAEYSRSFNAVLTHDLVLAYLSGEISNKDDAIQWMDRHRPFAES